jgi:hypothetical protein
LSPTGVEDMQHRVTFSFFLVVQQPRRKIGYKIDIGADRNDFGRTDSLAAIEGYEVC